MMYFQLFIPMFNTSITTLRNSPYKTANRYCLQDTHTHPNTYAHKYICIYTIHMYMYMYVSREKENISIFF